MGGTRSIRPAAVAGLLAWLLAGCGSSPAPPSRSAPATTAPSTTTRATTTTRASTTTARPAPRARYTDTQVAALAGWKRTATQGSGSDSTEGYGRAGWKNRDGCWIPIILNTRRQVRRHRRLLHVLGPGYGPWVVTNAAGDIGVHGAGKDGFGGNTTRVACRPSVGADLQRVP